MGEMQLSVALQIEDRAFAVPGNPVARGPVSFDNHSVRCIVQNKIHRPRLKPVCSDGNRLSEEQVKSAINRLLLAGALLRIRQDFAPRRTWTDGKPRATVYQDIVQLWLVSP